MNETLLPSVAVASAIDRVGGSSSSVIVPVAVAAVGDRVALVGVESGIRKVSLGSSRASSLVVTVTMADLDPAAIVTSVAVVTAV